VRSEIVRVSERWLALREPADAAARARDLVKALALHLPTARRRVIHDLGCGSGAMGRWLAPLLHGPQHWVLYDRDPGLLKAATARLPGRGADGADVTAETRQTDITRLRPDDLSGAAIITASALLDMLTDDELAGLAGLCVATRCPALLTLSVAGHVRLTPADPLDARLAAAFDAHQRRMTERGRLLGPDAPGVAIQKFSHLGAQVLQRPSPWRLNASQGDLILEWFSGWVGAACEQEPQLADRTEAYRRRRLAQAAAGQLAVIVEHTDLLVLPGRGPAAPISTG
jgi:SAM-dependent methyltransferase